MKNEEIGALLKDLRLKHNLTQAELAEKVYVTPQAVSRWEKGINTPNLVTLVELKKLYNVSVDELLLEVELKVDRVPPDKEHHWGLRFVLYPFLILFLCIGISQFYFFLNVNYAILITGLFFGAILIALMLILKVRKKGPLFLIVLGALLLVNGAIYLSNQRYFDLTEVPYLMVEESYDSGFLKMNAMPKGLRYDLDEHPMLIRYYVGQNDLAIYDLLSPIEGMMTVIPTSRPIQQIVLLGETAYLSCYEFEATTSDLYALNLETHDLTLVHQGDKAYRLAASESTLYLNEVFDPFVDNHDILYRLDGNDVVIEQEFEFEVYDFVYSFGYQNFYLSIVQPGVNPVESTNIGIFDETFTLQSWVFEVKQQDHFELFADGLRVYSALDSRLIEIFWNEVTYTDLFCQVDSLHNSGSHLFLHNERLNQDLEIETRTVALDKQYKDANVEDVYWLETVQRHLGFSEGTIYELWPYSRQVEAIQLPWNWRIGWFFSVMPFLALFVTLGAKQTFAPKKPRLKKVKTPDASIAN